MAAVKTFALAVLVSGLLAQMAHADPITLQWRTWQPGVGNVSTSQPGIPLSYLNLFWPSLAAPSAAVESQTVQAPPAPAPLAPTQNTNIIPAASEAAAFQPAAAPTPTVDAFVNLGNGPYPDSNTLTTGNAQPWYNSSQVAALFGGQPTAQQQAAFDNTVIQRIEQTFQLSGVPITLTTNPDQPAAHTLSVVSNTANGSIPNAIGMTNLGGSGFDFIDQAAQAAQSVDQLEWIVAHNVSHELMLAFGVGENYDTTGNYIDARNASLAMMLNPNATFSQAAAQALLSTNFLANSETGLNPGAQLIPQAVPEPATLAFWSIAVAAAVLAQRRRLSRPAAPDARS